MRPLVMFLFLVHHPDISEALILPDAAFDTICAPRLRSILHVEGEQYLLADFSFFSQFSFHFDILPCLRSLLVCSLFLMLLFTS